MFKSQKRWHLPFRLLNYDLRMKHSHKTENPCKSLSQETMCRIFNLVCLVMSGNLEICGVRRMDFSAFKLILEYFVTITSSKFFMKIK